MRLTITQLAEQATYSTLTFSQTEKSTPTVASGIYLGVLYTIQLNDDIPQTVKKTNQKV